jgi:uroporphyrinogen decarboxylase
MHFEEVDRVPVWEMWYWEDTLQRWYEEGLPNDVNLPEYFGVDRRERAPVNIHLCPRFDEVTLEETDKYRIYMDGDGVTRQEFKKGGRRSMPHWIEFPLKNRDDWKELKKRLNPDSPARYPCWWEDVKREWKGRDYPLSIPAGSIYGYLRNWIGVENLSVMFYDDPDFVHEMMDYMGDFIVSVIHRALDEVHFDFAEMWEDMSYKTGSLLSPAMFREFMIPNYRKITSLLREHGVDVVFIDSDGNINELIPLWLETGINGFYPLEVVAGMDPVALRKKYGKDILLIGGINKIALAKGEDEIRRELESKIPFLCSQGGYIPWCDHLIPPDVSYKNYRFYLNMLKKMVNEAGRSARRAAPAASIA